LVDGISGARDSSLFLNYGNLKPVITQLLMKEKYESIRKKKLTDVIADDPIIEKRSPVNILLSFLSDPDPKTPRSMVNGRTAPAPSLKWRTNSSLRDYLLLDKH
jgi:hypothetical protein